MIHLVALTLYHMYLTTFASLRNTLALFKNPNRTRKLYTWGNISEGTALSSKPCMVALINGRGDLKLGNFLTRLIIVQHVKNFLVLFVMN